MSNTIETTFIGPIGRHVRNKYLSIESPFLLLNIQRRLKEKEDKIKTIHAYVIKTLPLNKHPKPQPECIISHSYTLEIVGRKKKKKKVKLLLLERTK